MAIAASFFGFLFVRSNLQLHLFLQHYSSFSSVRRQVLLVQGVPSSAISFNILQLDYDARFHRQLLSFISLFVLSFSVLSTLHGYLSI
jgi:hypothetical protein